MSFAKQVKIRMTELNISQKELAEQIGKSRAAVSQYLSSANVPRPEVQIRIAEVLGCTVEFLNSDVVKEPGEADTRNVSISECAKILGKSEQFVRVALQTGVAPFGFAVKNKTVYSYHISPKKLAEYVGA